MSSFFWHVLSLLWFLSLTIVLKVHVEESSVLLICRHKFSCKYYIIFTYFPPLLHQYFWLVFKYTLLLFTIWLQFFWNVMKEIREKQEDALCQQFILHYLFTQWCLFAYSKIYSIFKFIFALLTPAIFFHD